MMYGRSDFSENFTYMPLAVANLKQIVALVELRFGVQAFGFRLKSVRPERFGHTHNFDVKEIYDVLEKSSDIIRTYDIRFCNQNIKSKALANFVSLGIIVTARSKFGDDDDNQKQITLAGLNCSEYDFVYFKKAVFEVVKLEKYYPPGTDMYDALLASFIKSDYIDNESSAL